MSAHTPLPRLAAIGFTLLIAGVVAAVWTGDWIWLLLGFAALLTAAVWSAAESGGRDG
ncbi:hypothetical protein [Saccharopolyspora phatthalungensis]|uniref:Uncharacterized protein n=1 Tax=Saccharopolyspora phatthalungensis TaxID=664693 RepID=A0A840Q3B6_9PSEU|nr:hypothetical protein [Saccharopolyspora phatthalungensis]MBB5154986.1 hypothetical protein [Saccharopolyspora phatthalungensis]